MRKGRYATVNTDAKMGIAGQIPVPASALRDLDSSSPELVHDPATGMRISREAWNTVLRLKSQLSSFTVEIQHFLRRVV